MDEIVTKEGGTVIPIPIEDEVKKAYIDYSMSVIVSRALPDVRDGLKPVHRRILYSMEERNLRNSGPTRKCAKIVGDVLGSYHPHGDASVYDALVRLGQDFSLRYPVIHPQGNFGTIGGDPPAAYRYTEAKMARLAEVMVEDIKKETVDFIPNFDESTVEPTVLPAAFPFLLANGSSGIAVGMATNMPPHNLGEIAKAISAYIDNPEVSIDKLSTYMKGPDFPTGGVIYGRDGIIKAFKTGRGKVVMRGKFTIETDKKGKETIIFHEVPYQVNTTQLVAKIGELARDKIIEGISNVNDETSDRAGLRIVIELKRGATTKIVINQLFAKTALQSSFGIINLALVDGRPRLLSLKELIKYFVEHRVEVVTRRTQFDLKKAEERAHILRGLVIALNNIDEVIKIIKESSDIPVAKQTLSDRFKLTEIQAQAIVDMRLGRLTSLEIKKIEEELKELEVLIEKLKDLLANPNKILALIKSETNEIAKKYGDERRTEIISDDVEELNVEDLIQKEQMVVLISNFGYIKRVATSAYKSQNRGGKGSSSATLAQDDFLNQMFTASTHDYILFITSAGKAYWLKVHEIQESSRQSRGAHIKSLLAVSDDEEITAVVSLKEFNEKDCLLMATARGIVKKVTTNNFANAKTRGIIAIKLDEGDKLVAAILTSGKDEVMFVTRKGQALRVSEKEVRAMGRSTRGVIGIRLASDDALVSALRLSQDKKILVISENGYGKRVAFSEFSPHGRGTGGQRLYMLSEKTGKIVGALTVKDSDEVVCITGQGKTIRVAVKTISTMGRSAGGVRVLDIGKPDILIALDVVAEDEDDATMATIEEASNNEPKNSSATSSAEENTREYENDAKEEQYNGELF